MGEFTAQRLRSLLKSDPLSLFLVLTLCANAADGSASEYPQLAHPGDDTAEILETGNVTVGLGVCLNFLPDIEEQIAFSGSITRNRPPSLLHVASKHLVDIFMYFYHPACYAATPGSQGSAGGGG